MNAQRHVHDFGILVIKPEDWDRSHDPQNGNSPSLTIRVMGDRHFFPTRPEFFLITPDGAICNGTALVDKRTVPVQGAELTFAPDHLERLAGLAGALGKNIQVDHVTPEILCLHFPSDALHGSKDGTTPQNALHFLAEHLTPLQPAYTMAS